MDGMLSQEEINALLGNMSGDVADSPQASTDDVNLSPDECDVIGEISNICMGTAATTLYSLVNQKVTITTPTVSVCSWDDIVNEYRKPSVFINISYKAGIEGNNVLILCEEDVKVITDLMMGGDGTNLVDELSELHMSAICEAMNQMMGSSATSLSSMINRMVDISPPSAELVDFSNEADQNKLDIQKDTKFARVFFKMEIGELVDSSIMQLYPIELAKDLCTVFSSNQEEEPKAKLEEKTMEDIPLPPTQDAQAPQMGQMGQMPQMGQ
ncbi:MAG: flagellar motor switch phosphatase FliY, partial [Eubacteriales bacterium]|nr:flagellar motor switch phosphatase FliY [Eubacteriales bacterium]